MPPPDKKEIVKIINPSPKVGTIIEGRYRVESFKEINDWCGGDGFVTDLKENNKLKVIEDVYISNWQDPKQFKKIEEIAILMNQITNPNILCERFARHDGLLYRISERIDDKNAHHDQYSLYKKILKRTETQEKFTEEEIVEFVQKSLEILKYLNSIGLAVRTNINHGKFSYIDGEIKFSTFYFDLTDNLNKIKSMPPPFNISLDFFWLVGSIIYQMATLKLLINKGPFFDMEEKELLAYQKAKIQGKKKPRLPEFPKEYSQELIDMYERLIEVLPENRPTIDEILSTEIVRKLGRRSNDSETYRPKSYDSSPKNDNKETNNDYNNSSKNNYDDSYSRDDDSRDRRSRIENKKSSFCNII